MMKVTPKCPVPGCPAKTFFNGTIDNLNPQYGGKALFVIQCDQGHIIGPSTYVEFQGLLEHTNRLLAQILKAVNPKADQEEESGN